MSPKHRPFSVSKHLSLLVSPLLSRAMLPYCRVILSREMIPEAFTFCAFSMVGHFHSCLHRVVVPQQAGGRHLQPQWVGMGLVHDSREFCNALVALASSRPSLCTQAHKAQMLPSHWDFRPATLEQQEQTAMSDLPEGFWCDEYSVKTFSVLLLGHRPCIFLCLCSIQDLCAKQTERK